MNDSTAGTTDRAFSGDLSAKIRSSLNAPICAVGSAEFNALSAGTILLRRQMSSLTFDTTLELRYRLDASRALSDHTPISPVRPMALMRPTIAILVTSVLVDPEIPVSMRATINPRAIRHAVEPAMAVRVITTYDLTLLDSSLTSK